MTQKLFSVIFIGAGGINFGSTEGPWNHSKRLEQLLGAKLNVLAIIDPNKNVAQAKLAVKRSSNDLNVQTAWAKTQCFASVHEAKIALMDRDGKSVIDLIINGCPPHFRGTLLPGKDMDVQLLKAFGNGQTRACMIEKPVAASDPDSVDCQAVADMYRSFNGVVSVCYMLRYLRIVANVKATLKAHNITPMCINARYFMAYASADRIAWWNKGISCGPVVEQATHVCDLIRYLAGSSADLRNIHAQTVEHDEPAGKLSRMPFDEQSCVPAEERVPRITSATWKHANGTVANLCHGIVLHGDEYSTEIDIVADGWFIRLSDLYTPNPKLAVLQQGAKEWSIVSETDDPFLSEFDAVIQAVETGSTERVLSSYDDALETYKLTWAIRKAGEASHSNHFGLYT